jgi:hypothetical protein
MKRRGKKKGEESKNWRRKKKAPLPQTHQSYLVTARQPTNSGGHHRDLTRDLSSSLFKEWITAFVLYGTDCLHCPQRVGRPERPFSIWRMGLFLEGWKVLFV